MRAALLLLVACTEYRVHEPDPLPPAEPPGEDSDAFGSVPDWNTCTSGYYGQYYNLTQAHADHAVEGDTGLDFPTVDLDTADWWDSGARAFQRVDSSLTWGENWWPVDEGLANDPADFAVRWTAWMRLTGSDDVVLAVAASTDAWVVLEDELVWEVQGSTVYEPENITVSLPSGVLPVDIRMGQRGGPESAFRFRVVSGDAVICPPDFSEE